MVTAAICSDFGAQKNEVWHCFHCFPIYFPWSDGTKCHDLRFLHRASGEAQVIRYNRTVGPQEASPTCRQGSNQQGPHRQHGLGSTLPLCASNFSRRAPESEESQLSPPCWKQQPKRARILVLSWKVKEVWLLFTMNIKANDMVFSPCKFKISASPRDWKKAKCFRVCSKARHILPSNSGQIV